MKIKKPVDYVPECSRCKAKTHHKSGLCLACREVKPK